jgi:hypothetical protein
LDYLPKNIKILIYNYVVYDTMIHSLVIIIGLLSIASLIFSLCYATAETRAIPKSTPQAHEDQVQWGGKMQQEEEPEFRRDFAMEVQLEPHEVDYLEEGGMYQISDFFLEVSNSSELCPTSNCEFELEGGEMSGEITPGERQLTGKLRVNTGDSTRIMDLFAAWQSVQELEIEGEELQIIEGKLDVRSEPIDPGYEFHINGTLSSDGDDLILDAYGTAGRPYLNANI